MEQNEHIIFRGQAPKTAKCLDRIIRDLTIARNICYDGNAEVQTPIESDAGVAMKRTLLAHSMLSILLHTIIN